jgi:hypothetical protein
MTLLLRNAEPTDVRRGVYFGYLVTFGILVCVDYHENMTGMINQIGWLILLANMMIFIGFFIIPYTFRGEIE